MKKLTSEQSWGERVDILKVELNLNGVWDSDAGWDDCPYCERVLVIVRDKCFCIGCFIDSILNENTGEEQDRMYINSKDPRIKQYIADNNPDYQIVDEELQHPCPECGEEMEKWTKWIAQDESRPYRKCPNCGRTK